MDNPISFNEMYLFAQKVEQWNPLDVFNILSDNDRESISIDRFIQFTLNLELQDDIMQNVFNTIYEANRTNVNITDIYSLNLEDTLTKSTTPIGQSVSVMGSTRLHTANPLDILTYGEHIKQDNRVVVNTNNGELLMKYGDLLNNNIIMCDATTILQYIQNSTNESEETTLRLYFPFLYSQNITNSTLLDSNKQRLLDSTLASINSSNTKNHQESVQLIYDIYNTRDSEIEYEKQGIKAITATIMPEHKMNIPLDIIFKLLQSSSSMPFIKYNPGKRTENLYRIYAEQVSTTGKKIR